jgi:hypothetical protein
MKCWNSTNNAQVNIIVIHARVMEIQYGAIVEAFNKKTTRQNLIYHKNWWFSKFDPWLNANVLSCKFF